MMAPGNLDTQKDEREQFAGMQAGANGQNRTMGNAANLGNNANGAITTANSTE